jgi:hypothetical protein
MIYYIYLQSNDNLNKKGTQIKEDNKEKDNNNRWLC